MSWSITVSAFSLFWFGCEGTIAYLCRYHWDCSIKQNKTKKWLEVSVSRYTRQKERNHWPKKSSNCFCMFSFYPSSSFRVQIHVSDGVSNMWEQQQQKTTKGWWQLQMASKNWENSEWTRKKSNIICRPGQTSRCQKQFILKFRGQTSLTVNLRSYEAAVWRE